MSVLSKLRNIGSAATLAKWKSTVRRITRQSAALQNLSDEELTKKSLALKFEARSGTPLDHLIVPAYALVRESARRTISMEHYDVQLLGGIAIFDRSIAVMQTGEGKTLTATLPIYLNALRGEGAHLATANDYLAARDAELMMPVYQRLGLSVGVITNQSNRLQRHRAYHCDITYTTAKEIGFDFLRDRLITRQMEFDGISQIPAMVQSKTDSNLQIVQRDLNYILVDEADSILIDEARTPLIVSSVPDEVAQAAITLYNWAAEVSPGFRIDEDFSIDSDSNQITLTSQGRRQVRVLPQPDLLKQTPIMDIYDQVEQAIYVNQNYIADRHYVIRDGEVVIVDEFTGRLAEGRKWRAGIHQAIEAREGLKVSVETGESARITLQDLFLKYNALSGMTGTAAKSERELESIYEVQVVNVPTNRPPRRVQLPTCVFGTDDQKWQAIADEIEGLHATGRPVLIGTRSIDKSEILSEILTRRKIKHEVLNARYLEREAEIVAAAGALGRVTVATNMAGRGTDIKLSNEALAAGGLHVICSELHESARIDRQLIGRCGRQGDPGSFRQYLSLEDEILENGIGESAAEKLRAYHEAPTGALRRFAPVFHKAQANIQHNHFKSRKMLLYQETRRQEMQRTMGQDPYLDTAGS
jgi:preprotein translocase subunit SecA